MTSLPAPSSAGHPGASVDRGPRDVREEFAEHAALVLQPGAVVFRPTTTVFGSLEGPQETGVLHVQISKERLRLTGDAALRWRGRRRRRARGGREERKDKRELDRNLKRRSKGGRQEIEVQVRKPWGWGRGEARRNEGKRKSGGEGRGSKVRDIGKNERLGEKEGQKRR